MELISLVLATYGRCDDVGRVLDSLAAQTDQGFEVLVVDQNPDERLEPHIANGIALGLSIRHLKEATPNLSAARNRGIAEARGKVVGFPDDDCWYEPNVVAEVRRAFASSATTDGIAGAWVEELEAQKVKLANEPLRAEDWRKFKGHHASSICLFFRQSCFVRWGNFDARLGVGQWFGAGEETDLVMRFMAHGARLSYTPAVRVHHVFAVRRPAIAWGNLYAARRRGRGVGAIYAKHTMPAWVITRGLAGQFVRPLLSGRIRAAVLGSFASLGTLEGYLRWRVAGFSSRA